MGERERAKTKNYGHDPGALKNRPRGNPAKGRAAMLAERAERDAERSA